ncbi:hypothetical protein [Alienimonas sp. DA493]|uniref:hypothetical protein n=1 Tax=Alienimonas sp. DA493 TaxID=3373605 RepID=UPI00375520DF
MTRYRDGKTSGCGPIPDDVVHADRLGITPAHHRLVHELTHHIVGFRYYRDPNGSKVIWRDAHGTWSETPQVKPGWNENAQEEWFVQAVAYAALDRLPEGDADADNLRWALVDLSERADPDAVIGEVRDLLGREGPVVECEGVRPPARPGGAGRGPSSVTAAGRT